MSAYIKLGNLKAGLLQMIGVTPDGKGFDDQDARLQLDQGTPRSPSPPISLADERD